MLDASGRKPAEERHPSIAIPARIPAIGARL